MKIFLEFARLFNHYSVSSAVGSTWGPQPKLEESKVQSQEYSSRPRFWGWKSSPWTPDSMSEACALAEETEEELICSPQRLRQWSGWSLLCKEALRRAGVLCQWGPALDTDAGSSRCLVNLGDAGKLRWGCQFPVSPQIWCQPLLNLLSAGDLS